VRTKRGRSRRKASVSTRLSPYGLLNIKSGVNVTVHWLHKMLARPLTQNFYNVGLCVKLSSDFSGFNADRAHKLKIFFANLFVYGVVTLRALHKTLTYLFQMFVDPFCECFLLDGVSFVWKRRKGVSKMRFIRGGLVSGIAFKLRLWFY